MPFVRALGYIPVFATSFSILAISLYRSSPAYFKSSAFTQSSPGLLFSFSLFTAFFLFLLYQKEFS